jgi:hypothetical protein
MAKRIPILSYRPPPRRQPVEWAGLIFLLVPLLVLAILLALRLASKLD